MSQRVTPTQAMVAVSFSDSSNIALPCRSLRCWMKSCNAVSWNIFTIFVFNHKTQTSKVIKHKHDL